LNKMTVKEEFLMLYQTAVLANPPKRRSTKKSMWLMFRAIRIPQESLERELAADTLRTLLDLATEAYQVFAAILANEPYNMPDWLREVLDRNVA